MEVLECKNWGEISDGYNIGRWEFAVADDVHRRNIGVQTYITYQCMYVRSYLGNKYMGLAEWNIYVDKNHTNIDANSESSLLFLCDIIYS